MQHLGAGAGALRTLRCGEGILLRIWWRDGKAVAVTPVVVVAMLMVAAPPSSRAPSPLPTTPPTPAPSADHINPTHL
ncbi:hypothetical protein K439DRAFT_1631610 [Ramaria rubella]|nr:hypothetical protein K439DRAFT_1631610 [Ramaria rubella]